MIKVKQTEKGLSIGGILLGVMLLAVLGFALAGICTSHLSLATRADRSISATNLARSTLSLAIANILENPEFGRERLATEIVVIKNDRGQGFLTFSDEDIKGDGFSFSTNNLDNDATVSGGLGEAVPSGTVHLVARGESGGVVRIAEAALRVPPYPWAIASSGSIETKNGVLVASLPPGVWPPPPIEELLPADILANSSDKAAITLGENSTIMGDVETPGNIIFSGDRAKSVVKGELLQRSKAVELPRLEASEHDPKENGLDFFEMEENYGGTEAMVLSGTNRREGDLSVTGPLELNQALLYVDGNVSISKGVKGSGLIVCTGNVEVESGLSLEGATELAVVAEGSVKIRGQGPASSTVRGVFYAGKGLEAEEISLIGTLLAGDAKSGVELDHVTFLAEQPRPVQVVQGGGGGGGGQFYLGSYVDTGRGTINPNLLVFGEGRPERGLPLLTIQVIPLAGNVYRFHIGASSGDSATFESPLEEERVAVKLSSRASRLRLLPQSGDGPSREIELDPSLFEQLGALIGGSVPPSSTEPITNPSLTLYDISRFIPMEDRIRVISWFEH